ncbi:MAG: SOS response-associated peptidase family protein, partial [Ferruginibacter sp.]
LLIPALYNFPDLNGEDISRIKAIGNKDMIKAVDKVVNLETGEITGTYTMFTREANQKMKHIHNHGENKHRMPLFMQPEKSIRWLDANLSKHEAKEILAYEIPAEALEAWPVDTIRTSKMRKDGKEKWEPYNWPTLPDLGNDYPITPQLSLF